MAELIKGLRGMNDILPSESARWQHLEAVVGRILEQYGYRQIRTPLLEQTGLFRRAIGAATDIVEKEMYTFVDELNGEQLTLRPEATASTVRAVIEHNLLYNGPQRLWYSGPMFRHERPQQGRYRQFYQMGAEALGFAGPDVDVEMLALCARLWRELGIASAISLQLNSLGSSDERSRHRAELVTYLEQHRDALDADSQRRLLTNPLRVLDSKNPALQALIDGAPQLLALLGPESRAHFDALCAGLERAGIAYSINPRLVRGLDYYNLTVFEWVTDRLGAQGTVCGGGRYDGLVEQIGGKPAPGLGFAMGVERLLALMEELAVTPAAAVPDAYMVYQGEAATRIALATAERLRDAGLAVLMHCGGGSFKVQMKKADASQARVAVIVGDDEALAGVASVKPLRLQRGSSGEQTRVALDQLAQSIGRSA